MYDTKYCYPESNILKNKFGIKDLDKLHTEERFFSMNRLLMISESPVTGNFDLKHLQDIHKNIFQDVYDWAGKLRTVDIAKSNLFCRTDFMINMADDIFHSLKKDNYLIGADKEKIVDRLAFYFGEINALHPFREGNGRTQREFIRCLAAAAGYELNYKGISENQMLKASLGTFDLKYDNLKSLLHDNMKELSYSEQFDFCKSISKSKGDFTKIYKEYFNYINRITKDMKANGLKPVNEAVRKMESIHQKVGRELTVKDIHDIIKGKSDITDKAVISQCEELGKQFAHQEKVKLEVKNNINRSR